MTTRKKPVLGRNLSSMLSKTTLEQVRHGSVDDLQTLPLDVIRPGRYQPRSVFDAEKLAELENVPGKIDKLAALLNISRATLYRKLNKFGIK